IECNMLTMLSKQLGRFDALQFDAQPFSTQSLCSRTWASRADHTALGSDGHDAEAHRLIVGEAVKAGEGLPVRRREPAVLRARFAIPRDRVHEPDFFNRSTGRLESKLKKLRIAVRVTGIAVRRLRAGRLLAHIHPHAGKAHRKHDGWDQDPGRARE